MPLFSRDQIYNSNGVRLTRGLFSEYQGNLINLTLNHGKDGSVPFRKLFVPLTVDDPTEFTFATEVFGDFKFWEKLRECSFLKEELEASRAEAHASRCQKAFTSLMEAVGNGGATGVAAAKFILKRDWEEKGKGKEAEKKGKDTQEAIQKGLESSVASDVKRLQEYMN